MFSPVFLRFFRFYESSSGLNWTRQSCGWVGPKHKSDEMSLSTQRLSAAIGAVDNPSDVWVRTFANGRLGGRVPSHTHPQKPTSLTPELRTPPIRLPLQWLSPATRIPPHSIRYHPMTRMNRTSEGKYCIRRWTGVYIGLVCFLGLIYPSPVKNACKW